MEKVLAGQETSGSCSMGLEVPNDLQQQQIDSHLCGHKTWGQVDFVAGTGRRQIATILATGSSSGTAKKLLNLVQSVAHD
jgi:hypothetical protein